MKHFPRVLVAAANPFSRLSNNGLTLSSLFEGWPAERLAQVYVPFVTPAPPQFDVCRRFWALTPLGLKRVDESQSDVPAAEAAPPRPSAVRRLAMRLAGGSSPVVRAAQPLRELVYSRPGLLDGPAMDEIRAFAPDLIFSTLGSLGQLRLAGELSRRLNAPVVPFVTDDWITTEYSRAFGSRALRRHLEQAFHRVMSAAPLRLTISPIMSREYERRYGGEFPAFCRCVDASAFPATPIAERGEGEWTELVYAGQVGIGRWEQLRRVGEALRDLLAEGVRARLTIYTVPAHVDLYGRELTLDPVMRVAGSVPAEALPAIYDAADVLVHCESFDPELVRYTRFSLSTKVSEYMMAGRPLLGVGPAEVGSMRYIAASEAGVVIDRDDPSVVRDRLRELLADPARLAALGARARAWGLEHHDGPAVRERFRAALEQAAASGRAATAAAV